MQAYSHPADWWTLGVLMYALLVGEVSYYSADLSSLLKKEVIASTFCSHFSQMAEFHCQKEEKSMITFFSTLSWEETTILRWQRKSIVTCTSCRQSTLSPRNVARLSET